VSKAQYHHGDLRTAILDAAEETLAEKSLDAVSMRELARKAGVSSGAPYHHFCDRAGLVTALCQRGFMRLGNAVSLARDRDGLKGMSKAYLKFSQQNAALYQLMFSAEATEGDGKELLHPYASPVFELLEEEINNAMGAEQNQQANLAAISVWCFMHGAASLSAASPLQARLGRRSLNNFFYETVRKLIENGSR
jgi:AcrR family transcriptional regulator